MVGGYAGRVIPVLRYTVLRLALFVVAMYVAFLAGAGRLGAVVIGAVVSAALSYLFLSGQRQQVAQVVGERVERRLDRPGRFVQGMREDEQLEDAAADQAAEQTRPPTGAPPQDPEQPAGR